MNTFRQVKGLKLIGKGTFTRCYDNGDNVLLVSSCPVKECIALGWFSSSRLFPTMERLDYNDNAQLFTMKKYNKEKSLKTALKPAEYVLYNKLRDFASQWQAHSCTIRNGNLRHSEFVRMVKENKTLHHTVKTALIEAVDGLANYTSNIGFEVSPRNVSVDKGRLVLLDVFFSVDHLIETRSK